jgi:ribosomal protein S18 acetylase RimI-like enzyme
METDPGKEPMIPGKDPVSAGKKPGTLVARYTSDAGEYLDRVGLFLSRRPVEHSVLLSVAASRVDTVGATAAVTAGMTTGMTTGMTNQPNLWLWVEDDEHVVATAQHTPPHGAYLSTGPAEAIRTLARTLWQLRPGLPGVAGLEPAPQEFATQWSRLGGPQATPTMRMGLYAADEVTTPPGVPGALRLATHDDAPLLRRWAHEFFAESGATSSGSDEIGPRVDAGLLVVWEVDGAVVCMAATTAAQGGVSRVHFVYTPDENRRHGFASACVATLTARELATPGRTCMLFTDLANPTSNGIYQAVGYRRVGDAVQLAFDAPDLEPGGRG